MARSAAELSYGAHRGREIGPHSGFILTLRGRKAAPMAATWVTLEEAPLTRESLAAPLHNRIPAIRMRGFASGAESVAFARAARAGLPIRGATASASGHFSAACRIARW